MKKRFQTKTAKRIRNKAMAGVELVGAGAALTGGAMLLEEATKPKVAPTTWHDNIYATDNGATLFKYETLAGQEEAITTSEIIGYIILVICMILFFIIFARAIIKIKQMCGQNTNIFKVDSIQKKDDSTQEETLYKQSPHGNLESSVPSMEKTLEDLNNSSIFNPTTSSHDQALRGCYQEGSWKLRHTFFNQTKH